MARTVEAVGRVPKATRPKERPGFKPKKKLGRQRTRPSGRAALGLARLGRPIDTRAPERCKHRAVAYSERPVMQRSLDTIKR